MSACFCNSFNCKSSTSQLQPGSIFISARRDEGEARCAVFSTYLEFPPRDAVNITAHLLDLCCSRSYYWTLPTCGPHGSAAVSDCGDCAGTESDWASKDGRCRWAIIACRRCRSLQSCKRRWRKEAEIVVDVSHCNHQTEVIEMEGCEPDRSLEESVRSVSNTRKSTAGAECCMRI